MSYVYSTHFALLWTHSGYILSTLKNSDWDTFPFKSFKYHWKYFNADVSHPYFKEYFFALFNPWNIFWSTHQTIVLDIHALSTYSIHDKSHSIIIFFHLHNIHLCDNITLNKYFLRVKPFFVFITLSHHVVKSNSTGLTHSSW